MKPCNSSCPLPLSFPLGSAPMSGRKPKDRRKRARAEATRAAEEKQAQEESTPKKEEPDLVAAREWLKSLTPQHILNPDLFKEEHAAAWKASFSSAAPFPHLHITQFLDDDFAKKLLEELTNLDYALKRNDLFEFAQSDDLKGVDALKFPLIGKLKEAMYGDEFRQSLKAITGIEVTGLTTEVSMSAACYQQGHHLLPHDDELQGRRIAYIVYFVPSEDPTTSPSDQKHTGAWAEADGGALTLFDVNKKGEPENVVKRITPVWNSIAFFEVSAKSFHQVEEVLSKKVRVSISGWFHGKTLPPNPIVEEKLPKFYPPIDVPSQLDTWVSRDYRKPAVLKRAKKQFSDESSIELREFLRKDKYDELVQQLKQAQYTRVGPPNKRHYLQILHTPPAQGPAGPEQPELVKQLGQFMLSSEFRSLLSELSGLTLADGYVETRRFGSGDYTVSHDEDPEKVRCGLDVILCCIPKVRWSPAAGGTVHYLAVGHEEELFNSNPHPNTLTLVYREGAAPGTLRFTKYVNSGAKEPRMDFWAVYRDTDIGDGLGVEEEKDDGEAVAEAAASESEMSVTQDAQGDTDKTGRTRLPMNESEQFSNLHSYIR
eukprot:g49375.t1